MTQPAYAVARAVAGPVAEHLRLHRAALPEASNGLPEILPDAPVIEAMVDAAFWASVRREEGYIPKISLAYLPPLEQVQPMLFEEPLSLYPDALTKLAAAVERPGVHLGVWYSGDQLQVWGATHAIPPLCFVVEVIAPGLLVLKHRPRQESRKFVNVAVLEGDRIKIVDERAANINDCPELLTAMLRFDTGASGDDMVVSVLVQLALSMRKHGRGGILLVVPPGNDTWRESIVHPIRYAVKPVFTELADLALRAGEANQEWSEAITRALDAVAGLTAVDGATVITSRYELLAFGAKIARRRGGASVEQVVVTEPVEGGSPARLHPGQLGGTRHLSAAQFVRDQPGALALVASQDGRFTVFSVAAFAFKKNAHRVEVLLL